MRHLVLRTQQEAASEEPAKAQVVCEGTPCWLPQPALELHGVQGKGSHCKVMSDPCEIIKTLQSSCMLLHGRSDLLGTISSVGNRSNYLAQLK